MSYLSLLRRIFATPGAIGIGIAIFWLALIFSAITPLVPIVLVEDVGLSKLGLTAYFGFNTVAAIVFILWGGYTSDRRRARVRLVIIGGIMASVGYGGLAIVRTVPLIYLVGLLTMGLTILFPQLFAVAREGVLRDWKSKEQPMGIASLRALFSLGFVVGVVLSTRLSIIIQPARLFWVTAILAGGLTVYTASLIGKIDHRTQAPIGTGGRSAHKSARCAHFPPTRSGRNTLLPARIVIFILIFVGIVCMRASDSVRIVYLPIVFYRLFGDAVAVGNMFAVSAATELITMSTAGYAASIIGERKILILGALVGSVYFLALSFIQAAIPLYLLQVVYGLFTAALFGVGMSYMQGLIPHRIGLSSSLFASAMQAGTLVGISSPLLFAGYRQIIFVAPAILSFVGASLCALTVMIENHRRNHVQ